jgi:1-acyl-sn-glycerol-3-phosphate acyltransferase
MTYIPVTKQQLRGKITDEIAGILGLPKVGLRRKLLTPFFWRTADHFAALAAGFDEQVSRFGFSKAAEWILPRFTRGVTVQGHRSIPKEGPLLIGSNHPGSFDALAIAAHAARNDLKIVISWIPFIQNLPSTAVHMIWTSLDTHIRMLVVRSIIRHLREGGAALIFPSGSIDPDPDLMSGAREALSSWSKSLEVILRHAPETQFLTTIVSSVLDADLLHHPLTRIRREIRDRQRIAEFLHVMRGLFRPRRISTTARISFAKPIPAFQLSSRRGVLLEALVSKAQALLADHHACSPFPY